MRKHLQRFGNLFVISLLRSPFHRLASGSLLLITYRGRSSGRHFTIPVMYAEHAGTLTIFVGHPERKRWWRNLRGGAEVEIRLRGRRLQGQAEVVEDSAAVETYVDRYPRARTAIEIADSPTFVRVVGDVHRDMGAVIRSLTDGPSDGAQSADDVGETVLCGEVQRDVVQTGNAVWLGRTSG